MNGIILAFMLHTQMCPQCLKGERCSEAERLYDKWLALATNAATATDDKRPDVAEAA